MLPGETGLKVNPRGRSGPRPVPAADAGGRGPDVAEAALDVCVVLAAAIGEADPLLAAVEPRGTEMGFERADAVTCSSSAARTKLSCRAAASKQRRHSSGGRACMVVVAGRHRPARASRHRVSRCPRAPIGIYILCLRHITSLFQVVYTYLCYTSPWRELAREFTQHGGARHAGADASPGRVAPHSLVHARRITIVRRLRGTWCMAVRAVSRSQQVRRADTR